MSNEIALHSTTDMQTMANAMAKLFNKTPSDLFALMLIAQAENKHPAIAAQEYDIIQGRPALKSQATLSRFQSAGGTIKWKTRTDIEATATLFHPAGGELTVTWTIERAKKAGLTDKDTWRKFPAQMLSSRVVAEGVRAIYPMCLSGFYTTEEVQDFDDKPAPAMKQAEKPAQESKPSAKQAEAISKTAEAVDVESAVETAPEESSEDQQAKVDYIAYRSFMVKSIAEIVGAKDAPDAWTQEEKDAMQINKLLQDSKENLDINLLSVAGYRVKIGAKVRGTPEWLIMLPIIDDAGHDADKLQKILDGLSGDRLGAPKQEDTLELY